MSLFLVDPFFSFPAQIDEASLGNNLRGLLAAHATPPSDPRRVTPRGENASSFDERLVVKENGRVFFVGTSEVDWLEASGNYVALHVAGRSHLVHETMASMETRLNPANFVRLHRSTIVNVNRIEELRPHFNGEYIVLLKDGTRLKLSRGYLEKAKLALGLS